MTSSEAFDGVRSDTGSIVASRLKAPANERAAPLWHGKSLWCRHCFASPIAAADAETQDCRFENPHIDCVRSDHAELTVSQIPLASINDLAAVSLRRVGRRSFRQRAYSGRGACIKTTPERWHDRFPSIGGQ